MLASRGLARALRQAVAPLRAAPIARRRLTTCASGAKAGDHVKVQYTGTLDDGTVFDSNVDRDPLEFIIGGGQVIKGFDTAVTGLEVGGSRKARIPPEEAYGVRDSKLEMSFPADAAPKGLEVGMQVQLSNGRVASVIRMDPIDGFTLDLNHELAGKSLTFDVKLLGMTAAEKIKKATFGMGCFWGPELHYQRVPGVISTEVGYTNGSVDDPTYEQVCSGNTGHAEVVQVLYNPDEVTYDELLDVFWNRHDPTTLNRQGNDQGTQYRSGIYYHDDEQKEIATKSMEKAKARFKAPVVSELQQISKYYPAEPYHQQYLARGGRNGSAQNPSKGCTDPVRCYG